MYLRSLCGVGSTILGKSDWKSSIAVCVDMGRTPNIILFGFWAIKFQSSAQNTAMNPEKNKGKRDASQASFTSCFPHAKKSATETATIQQLYPASSASVSTLSSSGMCDVTVHRPPRVLVFVLWFM
jgi:hypothetical protein